MKNVLNTSGLLLGMLLVACTEFTIETPNPEQVIATRASADSESKEYYWSGGEKIYLDVDPAEMIVGFDNEQEIKVFAADISGENPFEERSMVLVKIKDEKVKVKVSADKANKKRVQKYKYSGYNDASFIMTGDIVMQPKEGVSAEKILEKFAVDVESVNKTDIGVIMRLTDWSKILSTANAIYESGMVIGAIPIS